MSDDENVDKGAVTPDELSASAMHANALPATDTCSCSTEVAVTCPPGEELKDGVCQTVSVTIDLDIEEYKEIVEASTGKTVIEIRGVAFHEGFNKNKWAISTSGVQNVITQMIGADLTLSHPTPDGHGFSRNMDGGIEEAVVGTIKEAWMETIPGGWNVRYTAHVVRTELFSALESGLWTRGDYGVSIGGFGVPDTADEEGVVFGSDFTFDHLAIVHRPAYDRASIDSAEKIEISSSSRLESDHNPTEEIPAEANVIIAEDSVTIKYQSEANPDCPQEATEMSDEITNVENDENEALAAEIEALKAEMVLREAAISEYEAQDSAREEESRVALVQKATEMGLKGHEDFSTDTLNSVISSWETSRPTFEAAVPATSAPTSAVEAAAPTSVVANYLNGELVETDENLYSRAYNAWASAWNRTLSGIEVSDGMRAKPYDEVKDQL